VFERKMLRRIFDLRGEVTGDGENYIMRNFIITPYGNKSRRFK
jgi:hypothetical protein